jgi:APA family basic amino acid/polyamine antiporter
MSVEELSISQAPLADALKKTSPKTANILASIALFATANTVLISLVSTSRLLLGLSRNQIIPPFFSLLRPSNGVPWIATLTISFFATLFIYIGRVEVLASISSFATLSAFLAVHIALISLRFKDPDHLRPFKIPWSFFKMPLTAFFGSIITIWLIFQFNAQVYMIGGLVILISSLLLIFIHLFPTK